MLSVYLAMYISVYFIYVSVFWYFSVYSSIKRNQQATLSSLLVFSSFDCFQYLGMFSVVFGIQ